MLRFEAAGDGLHLGLRALKRLAGFEPTEYLKVAIAHAHLARSSGERKPCFGEAREFEIRRHHSDDDALAFDSIEGASDDRGVAAEALLPEAIAEDDSLRRIRLQIGRAHV